MKLDRNLQLEILKYLRGSYPDILAVSKLPNYSSDQTFSGNMFYLKEHELIEGVSHDAFGEMQDLITAKITANGLDFLEDDGGIGAILNKVTIKFDDEDLNKLILSKIENTNASPEKINDIKSAIKKLPADGVKAIYMRLINYGLDKAPDALDLIQRYLAPSS